MSEDFLRAIKIARTSCKRRVEGLGEVLSFLSFAKSDKDSEAVSIMLNYEIEMLEDALIILKDAREDSE